MRSRGGAHVRRRPVKCILQSFTPQKGYASRGLPEQSRRPMRRVSRARAPFQNQKSETPAGTPTSGSVDEEANPKKEAGLLWKGTLGTHNRPTMFTIDHSCASVLGHNLPDMKKELDRKPLVVHCPTCGAAPGKKCELSTGQPRTSPHRDRRVIAKDSQT